MLAWSEKDHGVCTKLRLKAVRIRDMMASVSSSVSWNKSWLFIELVLHCANLSSVNICLQAYTGFWDASADSSLKKTPWMENVQNEDMSACEQILCKLVSRHEWLSCTVGGLGKPGIMLGMAVVPCLMTRAEHTPFWLLLCLWPIYSSSCNGMGAWLGQADVFSGPGTGQLHHLPCEQLSRHAWAA